jgi:Zn-dependent protease with chaperone function
LTAWVLSNQYEGENMNFDIDKAPPVEEELGEERRRIEEQIKTIKNRDTLITFLLILVTSIAIALVVYWSTGNTRYAAIAFSIFPIIGVVMSLAGLITVVGFRSNALRMIELRNDLIALNPVSEESLADVRKLGAKYAQVDIYRRKVADTGRSLVNGELAMFWAWDASTQAKTAKQRAYLESARGNMPASEAPST